MASDGPKSAYELAMERLRQRDREAGVEERPLTKAQKTANAEARQIYQASTAERENLHRDKLPRGLLRPGRLPRRRRERLRHRRGPLH